MVIKMKKRYYWVDIIKIIACILVIINHSAGYIFEYAGKTNTTTTVYSIIFSICKMGVPLFILSTGYLLLKDDKVDSYKKTFQRIYRIIIPLLGISFLHYIWVVGINKINIIEFLTKFITQPRQIYLWYLYMLIGLYLIIPFIQKMLKNFEKKDYLVFTILFLIIPSILPLLKVFFSISFSHYFSQALFPIFIALLVSGNYIAKIDLKRSYLFTAVICFILSISAFSGYMIYTYQTTQKISYALDSYNLLLILPAITLFYICRYIFENKSFNKITSKIISEISLTTFGTYLFHFLIIYQVYNLGIIQKIFSFNVYLGFITLISSIFIGCTILVFILRRIPIIKKFL